jgi:hypothetical protein
MIMKKIKFILLALVLLLSTSAIAETFGSQDNQVNTEQLESVTLEQLNIDLAVDLKTVHYSLQDNYNLKYDSEKETLNFTADKYIAVLNSLNKEYYTYLNNALTKYLTDYDEIYKQDIIYNRTMASKANKISFYESTYIMYVKEDCGKSRKYIANIYKPKV